MKESCMRGESYMQRENLKKKKKKKEKREREIKFEERKQREKLKRVCQWRREKT
jgi:hypothetical protein